MNLKKPKQTLSADFQEHLITQLLFFCATAQFVHLPTEQEQVPKEWSEAESAAGCNQNIQSHFKTKPLLHFTFAPPVVPLVREFLNQLDALAQQFDITSDQEFYTGPLPHNSKCETTRSLGGSCGCEISARNNYLNDGDYFASQYSVHSPP